MSRISAMAPHSRFDDLQQILADHGDTLRRKWKGTVYRCVIPRWARPEHLVSGKGALKFGGRWMRAGVTPAVYAATTESVALKESKGTFAHFAITRPTAGPRVIVDLEAALDRVFDLTDPARIPDRLPVEQMLDEDWEAENATGRETLAQAFGRALVNEQFSGLLVRSARDRRGRNLIWFPRNFRKGESVRIIGENELDRWITK